MDISLPEKILAFMEEGVYVVNQQFDLVYLNPVVEREFGPIAGRKCYEYFHELSQTCPCCQDGKLPVGQPVHRQWHSSKTRKSYELSISPIPGDDSAIWKLGVFRDITAYLMVESDLLFNRIRYRTLIETMTDGLLIQDEDCRVTYANDKACAFLGYDRDEIIGRPSVDFLDLPGRQVYQEEMVRRRTGETGSYELSWLRKDGQRVFAIVSARTLFDEKGQFKGSFAVVTDITELKRKETSLMESEKQIRSLSLQLLNSQETERKRISKELHDELGQALAVLKLSMKFVESRLPAEYADLRKECGESARYIDETIENVRRLSHDLSPLILEELGLSAALGRLFDYFRNSFEVHLMQTITDLDDLLSPQAKILIYRIFQEVFTNIVKHAEARTVSVTMNKNGGMLSFDIEDDGRGFASATGPGPGRDAKGMGLSSMAARAYMLHGLLEVQNRKGKGLRVRLSLPLPGKGEAR